MLEGFACAEFFLNRYQTLLGIGGALAAAIIAAAPVWRQVKLTGMQAALQLQPVIVAMEAEIADDLRIVEEAIIIERRIDNLFFLANVACEEGAHGSIVDHVHREMGAIDDLLDIADERSMPRFVDRLRLTPEVRALRRRLRTILLAFRHALRRPPPGPNKSPEQMIDEKFCTALSEKLDRLLGQLADCYQPIRSWLEVEQEQLRASASNVQKALAGF
jgi:hypothetical protein